MNSHLLDIAADIIRRAKSHGADAADAVIAESLSLSANVRLGELEDVERSESKDLGLRVFVGHAQATISTTDFAPSSLEAAAERAVAMAKIAPEDEFAGLAEPERIARQFEDLDLFDDAAPDAETLQARAKECEDASISVEGVTNSNGAGASYGVAGMCLAASNGFSGGYRRSSHGLSCSVIAGEGTAMESDYDFSSAVHMSNVEDVVKIGKSAGVRAVKALNPRKMDSVSAPVVFDPRVATNLISNFTSAISGSAIARGTSFLKDAMGEMIFAPGVAIIDDPFRKRGLRSRPFDGEGIATGALNLIEDGRLTTWLLDCRTARQLKLETNGRASRGVGSAPSPGVTNLYLAAGEKSPAELVSGIENGLYVTRMMGHGGNAVTGDYSNGVAGFWIENGEISFPVSEMTIAGNLRDMFANLEPANDLEFKRGTDAPTVRVEGMTIAGK
ncbi:MAG: TldD/PmbA family protein [Hyphomicrobiales bacterium]